MEGKKSQTYSSQSLAYVVDNRNYVGLFKQKRNFLQGYQVAHRIHRNQVQKPRMEPRSAGVLEPLPRLCHWKNRSLIASLGHWLPLLPNEF